MSVYVSFEEQRKQDASFTIQSMGIQLGINVGTAIIVMIGFSLLRPRNTLVYAPKAKFSSKQHQPPTIQSTGWLSWLKPVIRVSDDTLLQQIGCDALLYIRFVRLLRKLLLLMTILGVCALIPINIVATKNTGEWPPASGSIEMLSISGINLINGKLRDDPDTNWYWSPFVATYVFSGLIGYFMYRASCDYIEMRQYYLRLPENETSMKSLMVSRIPEPMRADQKLKEWIESTKAVPHPIQDTMIGHHSSTLTDLFEKHKVAVEQLEGTLASYLSDGKDTDNKKRPLVRVGGFLCFGGQKVDAIDYYTKQVADIDKHIKEIRHSEKTKTSHYGWISFERIEWAHSTQRSLAKHLRIRLSPTPDDLIWSNLPLDKKTQCAKRWIGHIIYWVFVFAWMIPMSALSATSNVINLIRLIPNSATFIDQHQVIMGLIQSYFSPIVMALFFYLLPLFFRFLSQQQGYWTQTTLDRKVLTKLYVFFIINNLLVFTLTSMFVGIYGQIKALIESGSLPSDESITSYIMQIAKNIAEVSTFWINFVCLKSLGLTINLAMLVPLLTITIRKFFTRPSPRKLREMAKPPEFDFPQSYNILLFFFTIALVYSVMSPLILPFALVYFTVASVVYKYMLMYIYVTKIESGGKMWPVLFQTVMTSCIFFQVTMIVVLALKGGSAQAYGLIPLPVLTWAYQYLYYRRMHTLGTYVRGTVASHASLDESFMGDQDHYKEKKQDLKHQFRDPAYHGKLTTPTVHDDVKHLLQKVYHHRPMAEDKEPHALSIRIHETIEKAHHAMDLDEHKGFHHAHHRMTLYEAQGPVQFETMTEQEIMEDLSSDEEDEEQVASVPSKQDIVEQVSFEHKLQHQEIQTKAPIQPTVFELPVHDKPERPESNHSLAFDAYPSEAMVEDIPLLVSQSPPPVEEEQPSLSPIPQQGRGVTSEYFEMYSSFTPNASMVSLHEEKTLVEEEESETRPVSLDAFGVHHSNTNPSIDHLNQRRHTFNAPSILVNVQEEEAGKTAEETEKQVSQEQITLHSSIRHRSMPPSQYQSTLSLPSIETSDHEGASSMDEEESRGSVEVKRQLSVPDLKRKTSIRRSSSIRRNKTVPSRPKEPQNPFEDQ